MAKQQSHRKRKPRELSAEAPRVLRLVERLPDSDVVSQLEALLRDAMDGRLIGFVAAAHYGGREYAYMGSGSMCDHPIMGAAAAHKLASKLMQSEN